MATGGASAAGNGDVRLWTLNREEELRVEVDAEHTVTITVSQHSAPGSVAACTQHST